MTLPEGSRDGIETLGVFVLGRHDNFGVDG